VVVAADNVGWLSTICFSAAEVPDDSGWQWRTSQWLRGLEQSAMKDKGLGTRSPDITSFLEKFTYFSLATDSISADPKILHLTEFLADTLYKCCKKHADICLQPRDRGPLTGDYWGTA